MKVILLLSGGIDSTVALAQGVNLGFEMYGFYIDYQSLHAEQEQLAIAKLKLQMPFTLREVRLELPTKDSALLNCMRPMTPETSVVPMRNTLFLSLAAAWAYEMVADQIWLGANKDDQNDYADCRPIFASSYNIMLKYAMGWDNPPTVELPLVHMSKQEIVSLGNQLGIDWADTFTCYTPNRAGRPCQHCPACQLRMRAMSLTGTVDKGYNEDN